MYGDNLIRGWKSYGLGKIIQMVRYLRRRKVKLLTWFMGKDVADTCNRLKMESPDQTKAIMCFRISTTVTKNITMPLSL